MLTKLTNCSVPNDEITLEGLVARFCDGKSVEK